MKKTTLRIQKNKNIFLYNTRISNIFINELLPEADGDCVKVFIFALMYAQNDLDMDFDTIARHLRLTKTAVLEAFEYWAQKGAVRLISDDEGFCVEFVSQIESLYGGAIEAPSEDEAPAGEAGGEPGEEATGQLTTDEKISRLMDDYIRQLYQEVEQASGRTLSTKEMNKIVECIKVYRITYDVYSYAIKYCKELEKYSIEYISTVALRWSEEGCRTIGDVKELLDKHSKRNSNFGAIFRELGFKRLPTPADREMMAKWFDEWDYSLADIIDACRRTVVRVREPNLNYLNAVLENMLLEKGGINTRALTNGGARASNEPKERHAKVSNQVLKEYYDYLRAAGEKAQSNRIDEVIGRVPAMEQVFKRIDDLNKKMIEYSFGMNKEKRQELRVERAKLEREKRELLKDNGYNEDYLERKYKCQLCKDTGSTDNGTTCVCSAARAEEAYRWMTERNKH